MTFAETVRRSSAWVKQIARSHTGEIVWACLFALVFGWPLARLIDPPKPDLKLYVVVGQQNSTETVSAFEKAVHDMSLIVGTAPVEIVIDQLGSDDALAATKKAKEIVARHDVLMVIAHLNSEAVEASLPIYFGATPKIPVITTVASDDDLLVNCAGQGKSDCTDESDFVPLLQLSPTNTEQGKWAVAFATEHGKRNFMVVYDDAGRTNSSYAKDLSKAYQKAVDQFNGEMSGEHAEVVGPFSMDSPPRDQDFEPGKPDCIFYAGGIGNVSRLLARVPPSSLPIMVVLSDSTVQPGMSAKDLESKIHPIHITYQTDAYDYNHHTNVFSLDSIAIASQLIGDLNKRGLGLTYRLKALFGLQTAADARKALVNVMKENAAFRTSYEGAPEQGIEGLSHPLYDFENHKRVNGIFHVWELRDPVFSKSSEMEDVDNWHPKRRVVTSGQAPNVTSSESSSHTAN